jgi:hypothetical protein
MIDKEKTLLSVIREAYGRALYTQKAHQKDADILVKHVNRLRIVRAILLVGTAGGTLYILFGENHLLSIADAIMASMALGVELLSFSFRPEERVLDHRKMANRLWLILEKYQNLISDIMDGRVSESDAQAARDRLSEETASVYASGPDTTPAGYEEARKALKFREERTFSDDELDRLLPPGLQQKS